MGKVITPKYKARYRDQKGWHDISWRGVANDNAAEALRRKLNASFCRGGTNYHISKAAGFIIHVSAVEVLINRADGRVVARADAPLFEVA